ncbi:MAG: DUF4097 family beta strand repeat-containing protein [Pyrinomonadaceae bacterium]
MKMISRNLKYIATAFAAAAIGITATNVIGQATVTKDKVKEYKGKSYSFCSNNNWSSNDRVSVNDLREMNVVAGGTIDVDAGKNGGVGVTGEDRGDVLVRACVQAWGSSEEAARALASSVRINTAGTIRAENATGNDNWSVSFQLSVPRSTNLKLAAHNGGISIANVDGSAEFATTNGGVSLNNLSGDVRGKTANGGVNVVLAGNTWRGNGLDVETKNGGVNLTLPRNYAARVETGTVNGGFKSDFPELNVTTEDLKGDDWSNRSRAKRISTNLNGGGAPIRVITTNGGIKINTSDME